MSLGSLIKNLVARAVVNLVDDSKKLQLLQLDVLADETVEDIERVQNFGLTSNPPKNAEAVVLFVNGQRDHGLVVAVDDRRYRIRNLASGEVAVYDQSGSVITLKANGDIEMRPHSGKVKLTGDLEATGEVTAKMGTILPVHLSTHQHAVVGSNAAGSVIFVPTGKTTPPV